tara:strand:- start:100 stop:1152 length:1053 start_codon:yes stop_codon:yes gene_type:complete
MANGTKDFGSPTSWDDLYLNPNVDYTAPGVDIKDYTRNVVGTAPITTSGGGGGRRTSPMDMITPIQSIGATPLQTTSFTSGGPIQATSPVGDVQYNIKGFDYSSPVGDQFGSGSNPLAGIGQNQAAMAGIIGGAAGIVQGLVGRGRRRRAQAAAQTQYDTMLAEYQNLDTSNLYANVENQYADMENVYEDATVNRQQAEFERDMFQQQQANIMSDLSAAAGGSGIAGLAQALSNQGLIARRQASATIGMQEKQNQDMKLREASRLQQMERTGEARAEAMRLAGAERARGLEYRQTGTMLGMSQQRLVAANQAVAQGNAALYGGIGKVIGGVAGFALGGPAGSALASSLVK